MKKRIVGVDETGRGALAGPIVAAAVLIIKPKLFPHNEVRDSKELTDIERRRLFLILEHACRVEYGIVDNEYIDRAGIQPANVLAVELALQRMQAARHRICCDYIGGFQRYTSFNFTISLHKKGEAKFPEIAAASIMAKVFRDNVMISLGRKYTLYLFDRHKGYGTEHHRKLVKRYGYSPVHRLSFSSR